MLDLGNSLTRKTKNTYTETTSVKKDGNDYVADGTNTTTRERSAMEAAGISAIYGGTSVNMSDPSVKSFNMNTMLDTVYGSIGSIAANISNGDAVLGAVPIVGDALDIFNNTEKLEYMGYITGKACVANNDGKDMGSKTAEWEDNKKYQRFIEDQRIAESAGLIEESAVTKFISEYYEKHPLDNSFEGILARYSGLTKDKVVATLDALEVLAFKEEYEPAGLYPYPVEDEGEKEYRIEDNDTIVNDYYIAYTNNVVYDSRRNRNFAV